MDEEQRSDDGLKTAEAWVIGLMAGLVVLALMGVAYTIGFDRGEDEAGPEPTATSGRQAPADAGEQPAPAGGPGEELFVSNCGSCHTLGAAATTGSTGPELDSLAPDAAQVLSAIENGGTGSGAMPQGLVEGERAQQVADYVGAVAGN